MPEITEAQHAEYRRYQQFGTPDEVDGKVKDAEKFKAENHKLREERREWKEKAVPEGAKVLQGKDAEEWDAFKALNKTPAQLAAGLVLEGDEKREYEAFKALDMKAADVATTVTERDELKQKDAQRARTDTIASVVEAMGWPKEAAATLADMKSLDEAAWEMKTEKTKDANGAEVEAKVPYVTPKGGQSTKFSEFAAANESLKGIRTTSGDNGPAPENRWPEQNTGGTSGERKPGDHAKAVAGQLDYTNL